MSRVCLQQLVACLTRACGLIPVLLSHSQDPQHSSRSRLACFKTCDAPPPNPQPSIYFSVVFQLQLNPKNPTKVTYTFQKGS